MVIVFNAEILPKAVWSGGVQLMANATLILVLEETRKDVQL
jgi:hypothetical protein